MVFRQLLVLLATVCCCNAFVVISKEVGTNANCYDFESSPIGFSYAQADIPGFWKWTGDGNYPNAIDFKNIPPSTQYLWTADNSGVATDSPLFEDISSTSVFGFSYYAQIQDPDGNGELYVYFQSNGGEPVKLLDVVTKTYESWTDVNLDCGQLGCCVSFPCSGQLRFVAHASTLYHTLFAIDNVQLDNACATASTVATTEITQPPTEVTTEITQIPSEVTTEITQTPNVVTTEITQTPTEATTETTQSPTAATTEITPTPTAATTEITATTLAPS